jgi:LysM repeat protein
MGDNSHQNPITLCFVKTRSIASVIGIISIVTVFSACGGDKSTSIETLPLLVSETTVAIPLESSTTTLVTSSEFYTVQQGDTLSAIAASFGVAVADIVAANGLPNADAIQAGQKLAIPGNGTAPSTTAVVTTTAPAAGASTTMAP